MSITGLVEVIKNHTVSGWCYSTEMTTPVIVSLYIDDIFIRSRRANNNRFDLEKRAGKLETGFNFHISHHLLENLPATGNARVLAGTDNIELPIMTGKSTVISGGSCDNGDSLREMLAGNYHIDHWGQLQISFGKDPRKIELMLDFYCDMRSIFRSEENLELYLTGGSLLGIIREFGFLPHDDDVDAAFCLRATDPKNASEEFFRVFDSLAPKLLSLGYRIILVAVGQFHVFKPGQTGIDIFLAWITPEKRWFRFTCAGGYFGTSTFRTREIDYLGRRILIPQYPEKELDLTYGDNWKEPDPYFFSKPTSKVEKVMRELQDTGSIKLRKWKDSLSQHS